MTSREITDPPELDADPDDEDDDEPDHSLTISRKQAIILVLAVATVIAFVVIVLPQLGDVRKTWNRLGEGNTWWLGIAFVMQLIATASYVALFQGVHVPPGYPIKFKESYQITMAGLAATRLFGAGGAGGVAVTAWALRRAGLPRREVAERMIAFLTLTYGFYMLAIIVSGVGLRYGVFPGKAPYALTMIPAYIAAIATALYLGLAFLPQDLEDRIAKVQPRSTRFGKVLAAIVGAPARLGDGTRFAIRCIRDPDLALLGTIGWWGGNIGILWACFHAFGSAPSLAIIVCGFFVGMLANLLPLPGGIGGVDAGMIGVYAGFGVSSGLAVITVLTYRLLAFWLPSIPGIFAYFQLRKTVAGWKDDRVRRRNAAQPGGTIKTEAI